MPRLAVHHTSAWRKLSVQEVARFGRCYYLSDDYRTLSKLRSRFSATIQVNTLGPVFQSVFRDLRHPIIEMLGDLNRQQDSTAWWGSPIASKGTAAAPLARNIVYLACVDRILAETSEDLLLITDSAALARCIVQIAPPRGYLGARQFGAWCTVSLWLRRHASYVARVLRFLRERASVSGMRFWRSVPEVGANLDQRPVIVVRSWITDGCFDGAGTYTDRNFGSLPEWLSSHGSIVTFLPIFFNLSQRRRVYRSMSESPWPFLVPERYLRVRDYLSVIREEIRCLRTKVGDVSIRRLPVKELVEEANKLVCFASLEERLCRPLLRHLRNEGVTIDRFLYGFEGNANEKVFLRACGESFPGAKTVGYQHTAYYPETLLHAMSSTEVQCHPVPDRVVCSGPSYLKTFEGLSFDRSEIVLGPNLRFAAVRGGIAPKRRSQQNGVSQRLLLPFTYSYDLAFELMEKIASVLREDPGIRAYLRGHPLLDRDTLDRFAGGISHLTYEFLDGGSFLDMAQRCDVVVSSGGSIAVIEAVVAGVPVVRVHPSNRFHYDPIAGFPYPIDPVMDADGIGRQLERIIELRAEDPDLFRRIGESALRAYFTDPVQADFSVF